MNIRPVSDLRNKYPEIEETLKTNGEIYLTKNGYGSAVLLNMERYSELTRKELPSHASRNKKAEGGKGFLRKYAAADLTALEKDAGRIHAMKKYGGKSDE